MFSNRTTRVRVLPLGRATAAVALATLGALAPATAACAHSRLTGTQPAGGTTVAAEPSAVRLLFDEAVSSRFAVVAVTGPSGARVDRGAPQVIAGTTIDQPVDELAAPGSYLVAYRVVSADGHPVSGQFRFSYAPTTAAEPVRPAAGSTRTGAAPPPEDPGVAGGHLLHYVGSILAIVVTLGVVGVERLRSRRRA